MKKSRKHTERRGSLLARTGDSYQTLKRVYQRMMSKATEQGEALLIRKIFA